MSRSAAILESLREQLVEVAHKNEAKVENHVCPNCNYRGKPMGKICPDCGTVMSKEK